MLKARLRIGLTIVALLIGLAEVTAQAQEVPQSVFPQLLIWGSLSAVEGGMVGAMLGVAVARASGVFRGCEGWWHCLALGLPSMGLGYLSGALFGATIGVYGVGSMMGVEGSVWLALGGAVIGEMVALAVGVAGAKVLRISTRGALFFSNLILVWLVGCPVAAGYGAAWGYIMYAKMKAEKSQPAALAWSLPLVEWRF